MLKPKELKPSYPGRNYAVPGALLIRDVYFSSRQAVFSAIRLILTITIGLRIVTIQFSLRGEILSALSNTLFDVYCSDSYTAKSLWDELDRKYNTEEQGLEKYSVSKFMRYQMIEDRSVAEQTHEIINLEHAMADAEMKLLEKFLVISIVDKFPKSWENFGRTLKHQKGRLSLDDLMIALSIEEEHRNQTHKMSVEHQPRANLIVGKQRVNKINLNSKPSIKARPPKIRNQKQTNHAGTVGRLDTGRSFVLIKRPRLGRQLSTWLWEVLTIYEHGCKHGCGRQLSTWPRLRLAPQEQQKGHHWKDSKHRELQYC
ncbi:hypothetical protein Sango_3116300 [Sesamum angolense]|uniref:Uncharacterized protein n=1 Tax=Sesamum angolense TaxID=2727404 RepID=A0AAE1T894_9LAMI|nr:hypothetical protein Sango_3116300 [Sesamum angolense]